MQMSEMARFIKALQFVGLNGDQIAEIIIYIEEGGDIEEKLPDLKGLIQQ